MVSRYISQYQKIGIINLIGVNHLVLHEFHIIALMESPCPGKFCCLQKPFKQQVPHHNFSSSTSPHVMSKFRDSSKWKSALKCSGCERETSPALTCLCLRCKTRFSACTGRERHEWVGGSWLRARPRCHRSVGLSRSVCLRQPTLRGDTKGHISRLPFSLWFCFCSSSFASHLWSEMRVGVDLRGRCVLFKMSQSSCTRAGKTTPQQQRRHASDVMNRTRLNRQAQKPMGIWLSAGRTRGQGEAMKIIEFSASPLLLTTAN